jgi:hypothetical protein
MSHNTIATAPSYHAYTSVSSYTEHISVCFKWFHNALKSFLYIAYVSTLTELLGAEVGCMYYQA